MLYGLHHTPAFFVCQEKFEKNLVLHKFQSRLSFCHTRTAYGLLLTAADKAAHSGAEYSPHRDPLKPAQGSALMCAQVINLAVGDDLRASRSESGSQ